MDEENTTPETGQRTNLPVLFRGNEPVPEDIPAPDFSEKIPETVPLPQKKHPVRRAFRILAVRVVPSVLLVFALTVYAVLAVTVAAEADFTVRGFVKTVLGGFTGDPERVLFTESAFPLRFSRMPALSPGIPDSAAVPPDMPAETESVPFTPDFPLYRLDLSSDASDGLGLTNETPYEVDLRTLAEAGRAIPPYDSGTQSADGNPVVLILHTHATEAYADTRVWDFRTDDCENNVVAIGKVIADRLAEHGIPTLHCTELFDSPEFSMAYYNAALAIRQYLAEYPSVSYILDIHRDSILSGDGWVSPVTRLGGSDAAQMMFVVGTDHGGSGHTGWRDNLALAVRLQKRLHGECPTLMRDINLRSASFNEQYTPGSLLVEIGSCASTLDEAKTAAGCFAEHLAAEILG